MHKAVMEHLMTVMVHTVEIAPAAVRLSARGLGFGLRVVLFN
ncbi:MAG: hypothetical protein ACKOOG_06185 [Actinomycetota bacterium]